MLTLCTSTCWMPAAANARLTGAALMNCGRAPITVVHFMVLTTLATWLPGFLQMEEVMVGIPPERKITPDFE